MSPEKTNTQEQTNMINQSKLQATICNLFKAHKKLHVQGGIGFGSATHGLKNWPEIVKPITKGHNCVIIFSSHLKTAPLPAALA